MGQKILEMQGIVKRFGRVVANDGVDFRLERGEIHALLGENGAGKTTLMNILYGIYSQDEGEMRIGGELYKPASPRDAISRGIGMVHQHFMLVPPMTVLQNIVLGQECKLSPMDLSEARREISALCEAYKFRLDLDRRLADLSVGEQQRVELVKALYRGADILILDEPTAVLTPQEVEELFVVLQQFMEQGKSTILISHKLWEVKRICGRVTVLRNGRLVDTVQACDVEREDLASMMVGREVSFEYEKTPVVAGDNILVLKNINMKGTKQATSLKDISFNVRRGEILGIAGVDGNGQRELSELLMGLKAADSGEVHYCGEDYSCIPTRKRIEQGFAHIPEDRMTQGLILDFSVSENLIVSCYDQAPYTKRGIFSAKAVRQMGEQLVEEYDVRPREPEALVRSFSGGNQQKIVVAREFARRPTLILAMQPTRGLDVGAMQFVHHKLFEGRHEGAGILLISADLDEILAVCDRVLVLNDGQIMGEFIPGEIDYARIGMMMGGTKQEVEKEGECA